jgi:hypothetical protein
MYSQFPPILPVGTSSCSSPDWCGIFYPDLTNPGHMIRVYSSKLPTVEIDTTWYHIPNRKMVETWKSQTPDGFIFSAKIPKVISHDKYLEECEAELNEFISVMSILGEKLGPLILQFPYVAKGKDPEEYRTGADFVRRSQWMRHGCPWHSKLLVLSFYGLTVATMTEFSLILEFFLDELKRVSQSDGYTSVVGVTCRIQLIHGNSMQFLKLLDYFFCPYVHWRLPYHKAYRKFA